MNLEKMFEMQRALDDRINKTHPVQEGEDRLAKKVMAFIVEVSELANEWRGFKFWSNIQEPTNRILEEYVDGLHFLLSIGIEQGKTSVKLFTRPAQVNVVDCFLDIYAFAVEMDMRCMYDDYDTLFNDYLLLGSILGFTLEQIEQAYFAKNKVNHQRQEDGY